MKPDLSDVNLHERAADQIPWYVNGTLEASAVADLEAHLKDCAPCRRDYEAQVRLFEAIRAEGSLVFAAEPSFQKLMAKISDHADAKELLGAALPTPSAPVLPLRRPYVRTRTVRWLAAAAMVEALCLGAGAWVWHAHDRVAAPYVTLTSAEPSYRDSPRIRIVFRSGLSVQGLGALLQSVGAHIIDGPTSANVYTLGFMKTGVTPALVEQRAAALRANVDVLFAEPQNVSRDSERGEAK